MTKIDRGLRKKVISLIVPIALQQLLLAAVSAGDSLMLGFVNGDAMAAVSLAANIEFIENLFLSAVVGGATILAAQYWGKHETKPIEEIFGLILRLSAVISLVFTTAALTLPEQLMRLFTDEAALIPLGADYIRMATGSYLLTGVSQCFLCIMKATGQTKRSVLINSFALTLDTVLNAVFIFGFGMGAQGAALTTSITRLIELTIVLACAGGMAVKPRLFSRIPSTLRGDFLHCSLPHLVNSLLWGIGTSVYAAIIGHLGAAVTAAYAVAAIVRNLSASLGRGACQGTQIVLADTLGADKIQEAKRLGAHLSLLSVAGGSLCAGLVFLTGPLLSFLMKLSDAARADLWSMICVSALYVWVQCFNMVVVCGVFAAGGDTAFDAYSVAVTMWILIIPLALAAAFWWGWSPLAVYLILSMDEIVKVPWILVHYKKYKWLKNITREDML